KEFDDCLTAQILDQSVIVLRGTDGALHGFYNVCGRPGHQLLSVSGHVKSVVCPVQTWSYRLDGQLRSARGLETSHGFDTGQFIFKPWKWDFFANEFVFFNIDPAARPLSELPSGLERELRSEFPILTCWRD